MKDRPNPFEEMQDKQIKTFFEGTTDRKIKANLDGTMGTFRFLGNIADIYLNRFVDTMVGMANGANVRDEDPAAGQSRLPGEGLPSEKKKNKYPNQ